MQEIKQVIKLAEENALLHRFIGDIALYLSSEGRISVQSYNTIPLSSFIFHKINELKEVDNNKDFTSLTPANDKS